MNREPCASVPTMHNVFICSPTVSSPSLQAFNSALAPGSLDNSLNRTVYPSKTATSIHSPFCNPMRRQSASKARRSKYPTPLQHHTTFRRVPMCTQARVRTHLVQSSSIDCRLPKLPSCTTSYVKPNLGRKGARGGPSWSPTNTTT